MKSFLKKQPSVIVACDVSRLSELGRLVRNTNKVRGIGGYKVGLELAVGNGLGKVVRLMRKYTRLPIIYDHQKAGNDIPQMGENFARVCKRAGVDAVILFPFAGPETQEAWIKACQTARLTVLVGAQMTQPKFLQAEGGFLSNEAPKKIFTLAAKLGVRDFVVPGNKVEYVRRYRRLLEKLVGKNKFQLYAPGFITQGGEISEFAREAGRFWHAIVGSAIYKAADQAAAARQLTQNVN